MWTIYENGQEAGVGPQFWEERLSKLFQIPGDRFLSLLKRLWLGRFLIENVPPESLILDAGCGSGFASQLLQSNGVRVVGVDYAFRLVKSCSEIHRSSRFICGDLRALPLKDRSLDGVVSLSSLEHVELGLDEALGELNRVLKKGGFFILIAPRPNFQDHFLSSTGSMFGLGTKGTVQTATGKKIWRQENEFHQEGHPSFHAYWMTSGHWKNLLKKKGFQMIKHERGDLVGGLMRSKIFGPKIKKVHESLIADWLMGVPKKSSDKIYEGLVFEGGQNRALRRVLDPLKIFYAYLNGLVFRKTEEIANT